MWNSQHDESDPGSSQISQFDRADQICDAFERAWLDGRQPLLKDYLLQVPQAERDNLQRELLPIQSDYEQRRKAANSPPCSPETVRLNRPAVARTYQGHPRSIGRYQIERLLGQGGFSRVYLAHDARLQRLVAVKVPHSEFAPMMEQLNAYLSEARTVAHLDHPHIVPVYDVGNAADFSCFVVSKYVEGCDLATRIKTGLMSYKEAVECVATVAEALHYAHCQGVVHRDVKPGNILLDRDGRPYVVDFGLAIREEDIDQGPNFLGTPAYMSPEQARGEGHRVDARSDIFSLGVVLYELLTGTRPFTGETQAELREQLMEHEPRSFAELEVNLPAELERICRKALARCAEERYPTAQCFADALRQFLHHQAAVAPKLVYPILVGAAVVATSAFGFLGLRSRSRSFNTLTAESAVAEANVAEVSSAVAEPDVGYSAEDLPADAPPLAIAPFDASQAREHQQAWADYLGVSTEQVVDLSGGVKLTMVLIPPGEFLMGSAEETQASVIEEAKASGDQWTIDHIRSEGPQHRVRITKPFWLGRHEVTREQYRQFVAETGYETEAERDGVGGYGLRQGQWIQDPRFVWNSDLDFPRTARDPVSYVSWNDALSFCSWLQEQKGGGDIALPTEAQWEYACRAGRTNRLTVSDLRERGWCGSSAGGKTHPVGQLRASGFGLYDMYGNVWEWCADWYGAEYYADSPMNDPTGPPTGAYRIQRGGDWVYGPRCCRSAYRHFGGTGDRSTSLGFRVAAYF